MMCEVTFKDGSTYTMELIYNWNRCHIYRTPTAYLIVPYGDVLISKVSQGEFIKAQQKAKNASTIKKATEWTEIELSSDLGTE